jgi:hypothetical protein
MYKQGLLTTSGEQGALLFFEGTKGLKPQFASFHFVCKYTETGRGNSQIIIKFYMETT